MRQTQGFQALDFFQSLGPGCLRSGESEMIWSDHSGMPEMTCYDSRQTQADCPRPLSDPGKGVIILKGVFSLERSLEALRSLNSLENGRNLLSFPQPGGFLETLESLNALESLENGLF